MGNVASPALRRGPLLSVSSLPIHAWGCGAGGPQAEGERRAAALLVGLPFNRLITDFHIPCVLQPTPSSQRGECVGPERCPGQSTRTSGALEPLRDYAGDCRTSRANGLLWLKGVESSRRHCTSTP